MRYFILQVQTYKNKLSNTKIYDTNTIFYNKWQHFISLEYHACEYGILELPIII